MMFVDESIDRDLLALRAHRAVFVQVELECLPRHKRQQGKVFTRAGLLLILPLCLPRSRKSGNPAIGTIKSQHHQIGVQLLHRAPLFARLASLDPQPMRQLLVKRVQLAGTLGNPELRLHCSAAQILADRVPRQTCAPGNLPDRQSISQMAATKCTQ